MKTLNCFTRGSRTQPAVLALCAVLFLTLVVFPITTFAQTSRNTYTRKQPTTSAMKLVSGNPDRRAVLIQNVGSVIVSLANSSSVTYTTGVLLAPNQRAVFLGDTSDIYGITNASTADLRIVETFGGNGSVTIERLNTTGVSNDAAANTVGMSDGVNIVAGNVLVYLLTTAITANSTTTSTAAGSLAITSHATGLGTVFRSDGTNWQLLAKYADHAQQTDTVTVATTSTTDSYVVVPYAATLLSVDCSGIDALTANDTNYITWTLTNLGQAGSGSTAMLAATDPNTTKSTGGTGLAANTKRTLTVHGTGANLIVAAGDRLRLRSTATGTLANTVTGFKCTLRSTRLS